MTAHLTHSFSVGGRRYVFDGSSLTIYEVDDPTVATHTSPKGNTGLTQPVFLRSVALNLINDCNLACSYCYASGGSYDKPGAVMSLEIARRSVDMVIASVSEHNGDTVTIGFFGGEPLLAADLIREIVDYTNSSMPEGITARYLITTNGTLLTPEVAEMMRANRFQVMLSIDGDETTHNAIRRYRSGRGSYSETVAAYELLKGKVPVTARITLSDANPLVHRAVASILSLGIKRVTYALDYQMGDPAFDRFRDSLNVLFREYEGSIRTGNFFDVTNITEPVSSIVLKKRKRSHCNAGVSYLSVSAEGQIYRCPRFTGNKSFALGQIGQKTKIRSEEATQQFLASLGEGAGDRTPSCAVCPFVFLCGGICYHHAFSVTGSAYAVVPRECEYRQELFQLTLNMLCRMSVPERRGFLLYLNQFWQDEGR